MNVTIASFSSEVYLPLSKITFDNNKVPYAEKHGYKTNLLLTESLEHYHNVLKYAYGFCRIERIIELLNTDVEWIWYSGADVIVTNDSIKIEDIVKDYDGFDLLVTMDVSHINDDSMLIRNTEWSKSYFKMLFDLRYSDVPDAQNLIIKTYLDHPQIKIIPQRLINAYDHALIKRNTNHSGQWEKGDFAIHFVNMGLEDRIKIVKQYMNI